jgi:hypothetical protein
MQSLDFNFRQAPRQAYMKGTAKLSSNPNLPNTSQQAILPTLSKLTTLEK